MTLSKKLAICIFYSPCLLAALLYLQGCYCFVETTANVRYLNTLVGRVVPCGFGLGESSPKINAYYGMRSTVKKDYLNALNTKGSLEPSFSTKGEFGLGIRDNFAFSSPRGPIFSLGLDASVTPSQLNYKTTYPMQGTFYSTIYLTHRRISVEARCITLAYFNMIGYITAGMGINSLKKDYTSGDLNFSYPINFNSTSLNYRIGYGLEYYISKKIGLSFEAGKYGGGFFRSGFFFHL